MSNSHLLLVNNLNLNKIVNLKLAINQAIIAKKKQIKSSILNKIQNYITDLKMKVNNTFLNNENSEKLKNNLNGDINFDVRLAAKVTVHKICRNHNI